MLMIYHFQKEIRQFTTKPQICMLELNYYNRNPLKSFSMRNFFHLCSITCLNLILVRVYEGLGSRTTLYYSGSWPGGAGFT